MQQIELTLYIPHNRLSSRQLPSSSSALVSHLNAAAQQVICQAATSARLIADEPRDEISGNSQQRAGVTSQSCRTAGHLPDEPIDEISVNSHPAAASWGLPESCPTQQISPHLMQLPAPLQVPVYSPAPPRAQAAGEAHSDRPAHHPEVPAGRGTGQQAPEGAPAAAARAQESQRTAPCCPRPPGPVTSCRRADSLRVLVVLSAKKPQITTSSAVLKVPGLGLQVRTGLLLHLRSQSKSISQICALPDIAGRPGLLQQGPAGSGVGRGL